MNFLYETAKNYNCKIILSYVDKDGKPLSFYKREGFEILGTVKDYLKINTQLNISDFENEQDYIIKKTI